MTHPTANAHVVTDEATSVDRETVLSVTGLEPVLDLATGREFTPEHLVVLTEGDRVWITAVGADDPSLPGDVAPLHLWTDQPSVDGQVLADLPPVLRAIVLAYRPDLTPVL